MFTKRGPRYDSCFTWSQFSSSRCSLGLPVKSSSAVSWEQRRKCSGSREKKHRKPAIQHDLPCIYFTSCIRTARRLRRIYLAMYAKQGKDDKVLRMCIETLSSLPSIVVGLFGYLVFLVFFGMGKSLMAECPLSVSILTLPLITTTTEDAIKGLPADIFRRV